MAKDLNDDDCEDIVNDLLDDNALRELVYAIEHQNWATARETLDLTFKDMPGMTEIIQRARYSRRSLG